MISIEDMTFEQLCQFLKDNNIESSISIDSWNSMNIETKKILAQDILYLIEEDLKRENNE